jgi:hypothetical protein
MPAKRRRLRPDSLGETATLHRREQFPTNRGRFRRKDAVVAALLTGWLAVALLIGATGWFRHASAPAVAITVWSLTLIVLVTVWKVSLLREWTATTSLRGLILFHITRFVGVYFLLLYQRHRLPYDFAVPGGIGDTLIATAALILFASRHLYESRSLVLLWNSFGLFDIVLVVTTALRLGLRNWQSMAALRELPLSLLPTFVVPLIIVSHILIFIRIARTRSAD